MTAVFPLFRLPYLAIKEVIKSMDNYELFGLSVQSTRSSQIVKIAVSKQTFKLTLILKRKTVKSMLQFENDHSTDLDMDSFFLPEGQSPPSALKLPGNSDVVPAIFQFPNRSSLPTLQWEEDHYTGAECLLRFMCTTFSIDSVRVCYFTRDKKLANATNALLKELKLKINFFMDHVNDYTFEQVQSIFSSIIGQLHIKYPRMKFKKFIILYQKWFVGSALIAMKYPPGIMNLEPLTKLFDKKLRLIIRDDMICFMVKDNGKEMSLVFSDKTFVIFKHGHPSD